MTVLGIDPGRDKCGVALCVPGRVVARAIVAPSELPRLVARWMADYQVETVVVGGGTGSQEILAALRGVSATGRRAEITVEDERATTLDARRRYFEDHPRRGWRRLVPVSFQVPPEAYDDYAAAVIAQRYVERAAVPQDRLKT
ncbi:MAG TPA: Holliday junction resolvase RuvX [bacterium]|nr:Holliday junction resolvase RuvX [bacterium]